MSGLAVFKLVSGFKMYCNETKPEQINYDPDELSRVRDIVVHITAVACKFLVIDKLFCFLAKLDADLQLGVFPREHLNYFKWYNIFCKQGGKITQDQLA